MTQNATFSPEVPDLLERHFQQLHLGSGISVDVIRERGYGTILGKAELRSLGFSMAQCRAPGLLIPLWSVDGRNVGYVFRPDDPRINAKRKVIKYEIPRGSSIKLDCPPRCINKLADPSIALWITEGVKKGDALASHGLCAIALSGVWGFKGTNQFGGKTLLADWDYIALNGRSVYIVFDSDVMVNPNVKQALDRLTEHMRRKEAQVFHVILPSENGEKVGIDD